MIYLAYCICPSWKWPRTNEDTQGRVRFTPDGSYCVKLFKFRYVKCEYTPELYAHHTRFTIFTLVVDDVGIKYRSKYDVLHLLTCLRFCMKLQLILLGPYI